MADFWQTIKKRKSVRSFDPNKPVSDVLIKKLLGAAKMAPSAGGIYPTDFVIIRDQETKIEIATAALNQRFLSEAPIIIVVTSDVEKTAATYGERGRNLYAIQDAAVAAENILLATTDSGLGSCWVGAFDEEEIKKILKLKKNVRPLTIIPIGYEK